MDTEKAAAITGAGAVAGDYAAGMLSSVVEDEVGDGSERG